MNNNKYALFGNTNIKYSLSPFIYKWLANYYQINDFDYILEFERGICEASVSDYCGYNVTSPYKNKAFDYVHSLDQSAIDAECINCVFEKKGYNTDLPAFIDSYKHLISDSNQIKRIIICGDGSMSKMLQHYFSSLNKEVVVHYYHEPLDESLLYGDLLINTTPCGQGEFQHQIALPPHCVNNFNYIMDLNYQPDINPLLICAKYYGIKHLNGIRMLIHQAIHNFSIWFSLTPNYSLIPLIKQYLDTIRFDGIALIGMPFSGKTTLAHNYDKMLDLDQYIEQETGRSIADIINNDSIAVFRQIESDLLDQVINIKKPSIISLGGGIVEKWENLNILRNYRIVWLNRPFSYLCYYFDQSRPSFPNENALKETYKERYLLYKAWETS